MAYTVLTSAQFSSIHYNAISSNMSKYTIMPTFRSLEIYRIVNAHSLVVETILTYYTHAFQIDINYSRR
jgi:hypothetical protein